MHTIQKINRTQMKRNILPLLLLFILTMMVLITPSIGQDANSSANSLDTSILKKDTLLGALLGFVASIIAFFVAYPKVKKTISNEVNDGIRKDIEREGEVIKKDLLASMKTDVSKDVRETVSGFLLTESKERNQIVNKLFDEHEFETAVKKKRLILTISSDKDSKEAIEALFDRFKFLHTSHKIKGDQQEMKHVELVIFKDPDASLGDTFIQDYLTKEKKKIPFIAYAKRRVNVDDYRMGFANSPFTLYSNMVNAFRFADTI